MFRFFPDANVARRAQIFEVWIRPVPAGQGHHALRIALHELGELALNGLTQEQFESTREYLSKNVFLLTSTQSDRLGYALDSRFYGTPEYTKYMRDGLAKLSLADVNAALKRHWSASKMRIVCITKDAEGLKRELLSDAPSSMTYESEKPRELLDDDARIGARKLQIDPARVRVLPVDEVFAR
jgi:zinc protease